MADLNDTLQILVFSKEQNTWDITETKWLLLMVAGSNIQVIHNPK